MVEFLHTALKHYATVGAVGEISRFVAAKVVRVMGSGALTIVEYGAGTGALTRRLLEELPPKGRLVAIELLPNFADTLRHLADPRLTILEGDVFELLPEVKNIYQGQVDIAVSNIPFSLMSEEKRVRVVRETFELLAPQGVFLVYQNMPIIAFQLRRFFPHISWYFEPRNFPPYFILAARK